MSDQPAEISRIDLPYQNLLLTGFVGVGKTIVGRRLAARLGVDFFDLDEEIELRELMSIAKIREQFGDSRLKALEYDVCRQAALMRRAVLVIPGGALLDSRNYGPLTEVSRTVCLTCELGEALRRMHLGSEQQYRDPTMRRRMLSRLRREMAITADPALLQLDTTHLSIEEEVELLVRLWATGECSNPLFHQGPRPSIRPPARIPVGLSVPRKPTRSEP